MHNNSNRISANEINRYVYCNYQWYYRRYYGDSTLTKMRKERNRALGITSDSRNHALVKGTRFHQQYHLWYQLKKIVYIVTAIGFIGFALFYGWWMIWKR